MYHDPATPLPAVPLEQEGWVPLAPIHLGIWCVLGLEVASALFWMFQVNLGSAFLPLRSIAFWLQTLAGWGIGAWGLVTAFRERPEADPRSQLPLWIATGILALRVILHVLNRIPSLALPMGWAFWQAFVISTLVLGVAALVLQVVRPTRMPGGPYEAALATALFAGGLHWVGLPILVVAALFGNPLLSALWQALKTPGTAFRNGWYDQLDEGLRQKNLGALALVSMLLVPGVAWIKISVFGRLFWDTYTWWTLLDLASLLAGSLLLSIHVIRSARKSGIPAGRALAWSALLFALLAVALVLIAGVLVMILLKGNRW